MPSNTHKKFTMGLRRPGKDYEEMSGANVPVTQRIPDPDDYLPPTPPDFEMSASVSVVPDGQCKLKSFNRIKVKVD